MPICTGLFRVLAASFALGGVGVLQSNAQVFVSLPNGGTTTPAPEGVAAALFDMVFSAPAAYSSSSSFSTGLGGVSGTLTTNVYSAVGTEFIPPWDPFEFASITSATGLNPSGGLGGYAFVYELKNLSSYSGGNHVGLTLLETLGWGSSVQMVVAFGGEESTALDLDGEGRVRPGKVTRTGDGTGVKFSYPPGSEEPPIFEGETGFKLIVFTDATNVSLVDATLTSKEFVGVADEEAVDGTTKTGTAQLYVGYKTTGTGVPDHAGTAGLCALALAALMAVRRRESSRRA